MGCKAQTFVGFAKQEGEMNKVTPNVKVHESGVGPLRLVEESIKSQCVK